MLTGMTPILKTGRENSTLQNKTEVGTSRHRMGLRRGNSKLADPAEVGIIHEVVGNEKHQSKCTPTEANKNKESDLEQ